MNMEENKNPEFVPESKNESTSEDIKTIRAFDLPDEEPEKTSGAERNTHMPPPPPPFAPENHSGEYRYVPPYAGIGANTANKGHNPPPPPPMPPFPPKNEPPKKEKAKKAIGFSRLALVLFLIGAIFLSAGAGIGGAAIYDKFIAPNNEADNQKNPLVINKVEHKPSDDEDLQFEGTYDISDVCSFVSSSVVEITTEFNKTYYGYYQYVQEGAGSGVIISEDGYVITNNHVITDSSTGSRADSITVRLNNGEEYSAEIIGNDADSDIALLKIDAKGLSCARVGDSDKLKVGEQVIAVGNPLGELGGTVTFGIVSATNREISVENNKMTLVQIDAAINPGNSGGGLFNIEGELIGIVNAKTTDVTVEGLGFAIPVNEAIHIVSELQENGYVTGKTHIGISLVDVTDAYTAYYYFKSEVPGVYIRLVQDGYNEDVLEYGDRITAINGDEVNTSEDVREAVKTAEVGDVLEFTISRKGKIKTVEVTCYEYVPETDVSFED